MMKKTFAIALCLLLITCPVFTSIGGEATDENKNVGENEDKSKGESVSLEDESVAQDDPIEILDWHDLDAVRENLSDDYILTNDLDENTAGYDDYNTALENYEVKEDAGEEEETWEEGDTIEIPFDDKNYDSVLAVEDEDGNPISHTVGQDTITIDEDTGERYIHVTYENAVVGFEPIGDDENPFTGTFYGKDHKISDLYLNRPDDHFVGLFGYTNDGAEISDVGAVDVSVSGKKRVGALVGYHDGEQVNDSYTVGNVSGKEYIGGLVGVNTGTLSNSYAVGNVSGKSIVSRVGGFVGDNVGTVNNSYATSEVIGENNVGGLVGRNFEGSVSNSYATGTVSGNSRIGGLVGYNEQSIVSNSYSTGEVNGDEHVGGLIGDNEGTVLTSYATGHVSGNGAVGGLTGDNAGTVKNSYAAGHVNGDANVGGLVGYNREGTVENSYWDIEASGIEDSNGGTGLITDEMTGEEAQQNMDGFDFEEIWEKVKKGQEDAEEDGYPILQELSRDEQLTYVYPKEEYILTINIEGNGTVEVNGEEIEDGWTGEFEEGTNVTLKALPVQDENWDFVEWTGDFEKKSDEITITIADDNKITAHFEREKTGSSLLPKEPRPEDEAEGVGDHEVNVNLSVLVEHEVERKMDVEFYDASNDDLIGVDKNVESGERANITWKGLANAARYEWYAVTDDGEETARSDSWRFLTWGEQEESKVTTDRVDNVTVNSTTLHGTLDHMGTTFAVDVFFEWRKSDDNTWNETLKQTMNSEGKFHHELMDLQPETKYEFRSVSDHSGSGSVLKFTTKPESESHNITIDIRGKGTVKVDGGEIETGWTHEYEEGAEVSFSHLKEGACQ